MVSLCGTTLVQSGFGDPFLHFNGEGGDRKNGLVSLAYTSWAKGMC